MTPSHRQSGHTLVEMVVVGMLVAVLGISASRAWQPVGHSIDGLRDRAVAASELRLAVEYLRQDLGGAEKVAQHGRDGIQIRREAASAFLAGVPQGSPDPGIRYRLDGDKLIREDLATKETFIVARALTGMKVRHHAGAEVRITLSAGPDSDRRDLTLAWAE